VGSPTSAEILSLKLADGATRQLLFSDAADTLHVVQGGVLSSDNNNAKNIGSTTTRGRITAGSASGTGLRELFLLQNQNTMTVNSVIIDNPNGGAGVSVTKGLDGAVVLTAANTYTGGTNVFRGTLQVNAAGGLGSGPVVVKGNARLQLQAAGTVTAAAGIEVKDQADVFLNGGGISWTQPGDIFTIRAGSTLIANQNSTSGVPNANQGTNSLTRVAGVPVNGGEVFLEPGAIVAHNTAFNGVNGAESNNSTIKNLGTNADLFFGIAATFNAGANQTVTLGTGTPWMGLSTDSRGSRAWQQGTITLNSDVTFQGGLVSGSITNLTLGGNAVAGSYSLANASSGPVRIFTANNVILDEDTPVSIAPNISFVVQSQSTLFPNRTNSFGSGANIASSVVVQAAGTLDPGTPFAAVQPAGTAGPLNAPVVIEAGGRLLLNDGNGVGSGALITVQPEGIVEVTNTSNALAGTADTGQFAFQPGSIFRLNQDNIYRVSNALGAQSVATLQVFGGNRALTSQSNPFLTIGVGTPVLAPEIVSLGTGGGITNDSSSRQLNVGRGNLRLTGTTDISATTGTTFSIQANLDLQPGAIMSVGLQELNGNPKRGDVRFVAPNSNTGDATTTISITGGTRLLLGTSTRSRMPRR
jgi:autotransporter-associated beta strand protein